MGHFMHGSYESYSVGFAFWSFLLKEGLEDIGVEDCYGSSIEESGSQDFISSFGNVSFSLDAGTALMCSGVYSYVSG